MSTRGSRVRVGVVAAAVASLVLLAAAPRTTTATAGGATELPNLVPLPAYDFSIATFGGGPTLIFAMATANRGDFALDLQFLPDDPTSDSEVAHQCIDWATDRVCLERRVAGNVIYHPEHGHHHFEDFALYELRRVRSNGTPIWSRKGLVTTSVKMSFCLIDVEPDRPADNPLYQAPHPLYMSCGAGAGYQGISPGWRDVYGAGTAGQEFDLSGVRDGTYALVIRSDPERRLMETSEKDNIALTVIRLSGGGTKVKVMCTSKPGSARCSS